LSISTEPKNEAFGHYLLRPEDIATPEFPVAMRGYDRDAVRRRLRRISECYAAVLRQRDQARAAAEDASDRATVVDGEVQTSARQLAQMTKRIAELETDLDLAQAKAIELERAGTNGGPAEPAPTGDASDELDHALARVAELEAEVARLRDAPPPAPAVSTPPEAPAAAVSTDPGELVVAALRVAAELRSNAREEARLALKKARERAEEIARDAERQVERAQAAAADVQRLEEAAGAARDELEQARSAQARAEQETESLRASTRDEVEQLRGAAAAATAELERAREAQVRAEQETAAVRSGLETEVEQLRAAAAAAADELTRAREAQARAEQESQTVRASLAAEMEQLRSAAASAQAELEGARAAQAEAEREMEELRTMAREEVEHTVASLEAQRERVQAVLGNALEDALAALRSGDGGPRSILEDLEARLSSEEAETAAETAAEPSDVTGDPPAGQQTSV
jgi:DivIVA domain-containing protein